MPRLRRRLRPWVAWLLLGLAGCERPALPEVDRPPLPDDLDEPDVARIDEVYAPVVGPAPPAPPEAAVYPAVMPDAAWAAGPPVEARRLVYRMELQVPSALGVRPKRVAPPVAELRVDVGHERLRARFEGLGWPVPPGTEVRLRADRPGVYLFDGHGGRPLLTGGLAAWFQGERPGFDPIVQLHRAGEEPLTGPGRLVCAFIAELTAQPREAVVRRCARHGAPARFRLGPWSALRTADVPLDLPRGALRADEVDPPEGIEPLSAGSLLPPSALSALPSRGYRPAGQTLQVRNRGASRLVVTVDGAAVAWVGPGSELGVEGLTPGTHLVGGLRPLGNVAVPARELRVPGQLTVLR